MTGSLGSRSDRRAASLRSPTEHLRPQNNIIRPETSKNKEDDVASERVDSLGFGVRHLWLFLASSPSLRLNSRQIQKS